MTEAPLNQYTADLVEGVVAHWTDINELLATYSQGWSLDRMPSVDRAILRLGVAEMMFVDDVAPRITIREMVQLAEKYGTADSPRFVNGVLDAVMRRVAPEGAAPAR